MRSDIFGECQGSCDNVFVQKIDIVTIRVGRVVVKGEITCKHRILMPPVSKCHPLTCRLELTRITPQLQTSTLRPVYSESLTTSSGAA